ncbi:MAG: LCP family protein, partial [Clostridiales bacterium]|nr:LCP family protein [Clostridiales bacterium]
MVIGFVISFIFAVTILLALARLIPLDIIPNKYLYGGIAILAGVWLFCFLTQFAEKKLLGKIIAGALSVALIFVFLFTSKVAGTLGKISGGALEQKNVMDVVVLKKDKANTIDDTLKYPYAYNSTADTSLVKQAVEMINKDHNAMIYTSTYTSWTDTYNALEENNSVKAVIVKDSLYESLIKESYPDFYENTKVVGQITITTTVQSSVNDKKVAHDPFVLYISGNDEQGEIKSGGRSDVNIFMVVNPKTRQVLLISTPRDSYITISNEDGYKGKDKLTHAGLAG